MKRAVFAGGCFWCTEAVFIRLKGVHNVKSGFTGGFIKNPAYREVCQGRTGHAEGIRLDYDESLISYADLLEDGKTRLRKNCQHRLDGRLPKWVGWLDAIFCDQSLRAAFQPKPRDRISGDRRPSRRNLPRFHQKRFPRCGW